MSAYASFVCLCDVCDVCLVTEKRTRIQLSVISVVIKRAQHSGTPALTFRNNKRSEGYCLELGKLMHILCVAKVCGLGQI